jgi:hypothetical protein
VTRRLALLVTAAATLGAQTYFPPHILGDSPEDEASRIRWYENHLRAMREPSLWDLSRNNTSVEVYRFLWLRSFDQPIAVRLVVTPTGGLLISKATSGKAGFGSGRLIRDRESVLSKESTSWFLQGVDRVDFWNAPSRDNRSAKTSEVSGAEWIIEGVRGGRYHVIDRWSPDSNDPAHVLGIMLVINLARLRLLYQQVY